MRIARRAATVGNASGRERVKRTLSRASASIEGVFTRLDPYAPTWSARRLSITITTTLGGISFA